MSVFYRVHSKVAVPNLRREIGHISKPLHDQYEHSELSHEDALGYATSALKGTVPWDSRNKMFRDELWDHIMGERKVFVSVTDSWLVAVHMAAQHQANHHECTVMVSVINGTLLSSQPLNAMVLIEGVKAGWAGDGHPKSQVDQVANMVMRDHEFFVHSFIPQSAFFDVPASDLWNALPKMMFPVHKDRAAFDHVAPFLVALLEKRLQDWERVWLHMSQQPDILAYKKLMAHDADKYKKQHPGHWEALLSKEAEKFAHAVVPPGKKLFQDDDVARQHIVSQTLKLARDLTAEATTHGSGIVVTTQ